MTRFLVGTSAYNAHVQQMALALHEHGRLAEYVTGGLDCFPNAPGRFARSTLRAWAPGLDRELQRRAALVPCASVRTRWRWELPRVVASRLGAWRLEDWWWERSERALDRYCAAEVPSAGIGGFLGVEHGAIAALTAARRHGKPAVVAFLSPHRGARETWVEAEFHRDPSLRSSADAALDRRARQRDATRDEEAATADWVIAGSKFTASTLVRAGVAERKLLVVAPGGPEPMDESLLPVAPPVPMRFLYVGNAAVHKGTHLLLRAWRHVACPGAELHLYGQNKLPAAVLEAALSGPGGDTIVVHGSVPATELPSAYRGASVLVFPTLCDGFGMVVSEAFANGLPVITTTNAGAADLVTDRKDGFVIPPADGDALVETMRWCTRHRDELFAMRRTALAAAARRTWAHFRGEFHRALIGAVEGPGAVGRPDAMRAPA